MTADNITPAPQPPKEGRRVVRCTGCRRPLTDLDSRALGYGPECRDRIPDPDRGVQQETLPGLDDA